MSRLSDHETGDTRHRRGLDMLTRPAVPHDANSALTAWPGRDAVGGGVGRPLGGRTRTRRWPRSVWTPYSSSEHHGPPGAAAMPPPAKTYSHTTSPPASHGDEREVQGERDLDRRSSACLLELVKCTGFRAPTARGHEPPPSRGPHRTRRASNATPGPAAGRAASSEPAPAGITGPG